MFRRKRRYSILVLLGIVAAIFLCFQLFSIKVLNLHSQSERSLQPPADKQVKISIIKDSDPNAQNAIDPVKNCLSENCEGKEDEKVYIRSNNKVVRKEQMEYMVKEAILNKGVQDLRKKNEESLWEFLERQYSRGDYPQRGEKNVTRGVYYKWAPLYEPQDKIFTCIISKEKIPASQVNDDYCDCEDHSDEPGTSACANSRFYCSFQLSRGPLRWVPANRVNDGICDCCDGSDEWVPHPLPAHVKLQEGGEYYGISQVPCKDRCQELRQREEQTLRMKQQGAQLKQAYLVAAKALQNADNRFYGPENVFYKLSLECFQGKGDKYTYNLCPFKKVEQSFGSSPAVVIGRVPSWISMDPTQGYELVMGEGSRQGCPEGDRETTVIFECGLSDAIQSVSEAERCTYKITFSTPAAC